MIKKLLTRFITFIMGFVGATITYQLSLKYDYNFTVIFLGGAATMAIVLTVRYWDKLIKD